MTDTLVPVKPVRLIINGEAVDAASGKTFTTVNPATEAPICAVAEAGAEDVDRAVKAARAAFESGPWPKLRPAERQRILWRLGDLIVAHGDELARLETLDNGKPIAESKNADLPMVYGCFHYFSGWVTKLSGETVPVNPSLFTYTLREPIGVLGAITPWNFPMIMVAWKTAPALAAGNTVVLKPAFETPLTAVRIGELALEAGLPPGVLNIVPGRGTVAGEALVQHPMVDKISFTGSTEVGRHILRKSADTLKKLTLELGGKSPNIVFADADPEAALRGAASGIFYGKGEVCAAGSRLLVEKSIHAEFVAKLAERARKLVPGDPLDPKTRLGALISEKQMTSVLGYVEAGVKEGARLVAGGQRQPVNGKGWFVQATVLDGVDNRMKVAQEEIFGPVLAVIPFDDAEDAVRKANDIPFGLAAGVWTRDVKKAHAVARALKAGTVWVNTYNLYDPAMPFGGYKSSGFGRDLGAECLRDVTQVKSVWMNLE
ncbi:MAG: aldehyde dehydrogenase family protein [Candidatus Eisenbacteria bacterium]|uniref:Aldehyde dehydrogenase family protein n=1 Tax=Eiseniibacteriota bacterium TaxID=2212470 RepID=A0A538U8H3_UNCEI|nr:MAG: aldehyde dehydrogenase family protein [Candidatus Eisenbacteria bacterium]